MHKYSYGKVPNSFCNFFNPFSIPNRTKSFVLENPENKFLEQFPNYFLVKEWNSCLLKLKLTESHKSFKNSLQESLISKYPNTVVCKSKSCTDCNPPVIYLAR